MDSASPIWCLLCVCLFVGLPNVSGLMCYNCVDADSPNATVKAAISAYSLSNPTCRGDVDKETTALTKQTCSNPPNLMVFKCGYAMGTADALIGQTKEQILFHIRACYPEPINNGDQCRGLTDQDKTELAGLFGDLTTVSNIQGTGCTCSEELCNAQMAPQPAVICLLLGLFLSLSRVPF